MTASSDCAAHRLDELVGLLAGRREPLAEVDALGLELLDRALHTLVEVGVDHRLGRLDVDERAERGGDRVDELLAGPVELLLAERRAQRGVPLVEGLELAEVLADPFVVEFAELLFLDGGDLDGEVGLALGALRRRGERELVAGRRADQLLVEVVGDPALADLVGPVLGVEPDDFLAVTERGEVERDVVAGDDRAVGVDERGVAALLGLVRLGRGRRR